MSNFERLKRYVAKQVIPTLSYHPRALLTKVPNRSSRAQKARTKPTPTIIKNQLEAEEP